VRVSLTEAPELEAPVAQALIDRYTHRATEAKPILVPGGDRKKGDRGPEEALPVNPFGYHRRSTHEVLNFGGTNVPRVVADFSGVRDVQMADLKAVGHFYLPLLDKWKMNDLGADYLYAGGQPVPFMIANGSRQILDYTAWLRAEDQTNTYPLLTPDEYFAPGPRHGQMNLLALSIGDLGEEMRQRLKDDRQTVLVAETDNAHAMPELRQLCFALIEHRITAPVVIRRTFPAALSDDKLQLYAATDVGGLLIDGLGDGVLLGASPVAREAKSALLKRLAAYNATAFGILQAARTRMSKTEYISCPSCGRTLFDLQETTATIRKRTDHLKGVKIGIMGCIVNGPGEMADADYGYVGVGKDRISLYRGQNVVKKFVPAPNAVDELIELIREDGRWLEPESVEE
jgi:(E)-4-hydroxy-3-methylbut-2-enyl-diphosphate synthase